MATTGLLQDLNTAQSTDRDLETTTEVVQLPHEQIDKYIINFI